MARQKEEGRRKEGREKERSARNWNGLLIVSGEEKNEERGGKDREGGSAMLALPHSLSL